MDALQGAIDVDTNIFFPINRMHNMYFDAEFNLQMQQNSD